MDKIYNPVPNAGKGAEQLIISFSAVGLQNDAAIFRRLFAIFYKYTLNIRNTQCLFREVEICSCKHLLTGVHAVQVINTKPRGKQEIL